MNISLSDFDHENERHISIQINKDLTMWISRSIETNEDYLEDSSEPPEEWTDECTLQFKTSASIKSFTVDLCKELIQACFCYFHEGSQIDSTDESVKLIIEELDRQEFEAVPGSQETENIGNYKEQLLSFPR